MATIQFLTILLTVTCFLGGVVSVTDKEFEVCDEHMNVVRICYLYCWKKLNRISSPPATKLRQGNVFTFVCDSAHREGGSVWGGLCAEESLSGRSPYRNMQAVRILLECILVFSAFCCLWNINYLCNMTIVSTQYRTVVTYTP